MASHEIEDGGPGPHDEDGGQRAPLLQRGTPSHDIGHGEQLSIPKILALTCINGGLQVFFSTVMADLAPYLQHLGLSKSATAIITICLPLSGAFVGPAAGALSDGLHTRFGRRRPMILAGALLTVLWLLLLAWAEQLVALLAGSDSTSNVPVLILAITTTIFLSISVQPVQAGVRSLMVDVAPARQQSRVSGWAGRIQGVMAIFSFFASSRDLPALPGLGALTQFQALACLNFVTLGSSVLITCVCIREEDARGGSEGMDGLEGVKRTFRRVFRIARRLPGKVEQTCKVQFSSWMAWFPLLYYTTTFIGELEPADTAAHTSQDSDDALAQAGSLASLSFAIVGFLVITALPSLLPFARKALSKRRAHDADPDSDTANQRSLIWLWVLTQPLLGVLLLATLAAAFQWQGIVLVAVAGLPWAVTQWVPFAVVGYEVSSARDDEDGADSQAGAIMGLHNMAISLPQVLSGLIASAMYKLADVAGSKTPTGWVLAVNCVPALVAAFLASRMLRERQ